MADLVTRWADDVLSVAPSADPEPVAVAGRDLVSRWSEGHRHYHDLRHLDEVLAALGELAAAGEVAGSDTVVARLAGWFHDAVYETGAAPGSNETASAALAEAVLGALGVDGGTAGRVVGLVRMTADHASAGADPAEIAFHDADLWVLAAPVDRFDEYCAQVRDEYASVPDPTYRTARCGILRSLVGSDGLYRTAYARGAWESRARANLDRELTRLS